MVPRRSPPTFGHLKCHRRHSTPPRRRRPCCRRACSPRPRPKQPPQPCLHARLLGRGPTSCRSRAPRTGGSGGAGGTGSSVAAVAAGSQQRSQPMSQQSFSQGIVGSGSASSLLHSQLQLS